MRFVHGDISLDVDGDWFDESKIAFVEPPDASIAQDFAKRAATSGASVNMQAVPPKPRKNFVLSSRPYTLEVPPKEFVENELKAMIKAIPNVKGGEIGWAKMGDADAAVQDIEIGMEGVVLKQLHALAVLNGKVFHFVGTTTPGGFAKAKDKFLATMASLRVEGSKG